MENDKLICYKSNLWPCHTLQMLDWDQNDKKNGRKPLRTGANFNFWDGNGIASRATYFLLPTKAFQ